MVASTSVTLTVDQLQDLLQAQTTSLEQLVTNQIAHLQEHLESTMDQKLQSKFDEAEASLKQFMKESMEDDDDDTNQDLVFIKDHVLQMEQSMTANGLMESPATMKGSAPSTSFSKTATTPAAATTPNHTTSDNDSDNNLVILEQILQQTCQRMEESLDDHMAQMMTQVDEKLASLSSSSSRSIKRSPSLDQSNHSVSNRATSQQYEDALSRHMATMEQFIDSRHSELEAYYSSASDKLHKLVAETIQDVSYRYKGGVTKAELEAVLDARMMDGGSDDDEDDDNNNDHHHEKDHHNSHLLTPKKHPDATATTTTTMTTTKALEQLLQQQKEWIDLQTSTSALELQVQQKLQAFDAAQNNGGTSHGSTTASSSSLQMIHGKLESLEKVVLAAMATSAVNSSSSERTKTKRQSNNKSSIMPSSSSSSSRRKSGTTMDDSSSKRASVSEIADRMMGGGSSNKRGPSTTSTSTHDDAYMDVSVDGQRLRSMNADLDESNKSGGSGSAVKSFMSTLNNWRDLNTKKEKGIREERTDEDEDDINDIDEGDDDDVISDSDNENNDVADGQSSKASSSVDSSNHGDDEDNIINKAVVKALVQLETKLDRVEGKVKELAKTANRSDSVNGMTIDELEEMVSNANDTLKSDLKEWLLQQQDELTNSGQSESGQDTGADIIRRETPASSSRSVSQDDLQQLRGKLNAIETVVTTNQELLQEHRQREVAPVPQELPLQRDILMSSSQSSAELERKILSHLDTMDKSVQFKLDEIFTELQGDEPASRRRGSDRSNLSVLSADDQTAIAKVIQSHFRGLEAAITAQLKESIPDYGMAKSLIGESLEEMRQIVSEVAISEVELLKTQLGVAEEAEQEALHAIIVLKGELEETKEQERRAKTPARQSDSSGGLFSFGPLGNLAGALSGAQTQAQRTPRESMLSHVSGLSHNSATGAMGYHVPQYVGSGAAFNKRKSPGQKLEGWKNQFADMEDKSTDLRTLYSQLRGQDAEDWLANEDQRNKMASKATAAPAKSSLKPSGRYAAGESKEMEDLSDADGDWI